MATAKLPYFLKPMTKLAGSLGLIQATFCMFFTSVAVVSYTHCETIFNYSSESSYIIRVIHNYYLLDRNCTSFASFDGQVMTSDHVYAWNIVQLTLACVWFLVSTSLFFYITNANIEYVNTALYIWGINTFAVVGVDATLAILFGIDFGNVQDLLNAKNVVDDDFREYEHLMLGTFALMTLSLRGYVLELLNIGVACILFYGAFEINKILNEAEHNVHNMPPLRAYANTAPKFLSRSSSHFDNHSLYDNSTSRSPRFYEQPPSLRNSDLMNQNTVERRSPSAMPGRPFSYLSDPPSSPIASTAPKPLQSPVRTPWTKEAWEGPDLPAPDYSPVLQRNLKSVLKTN